MVAKELIEKYNFTQVAAARKLGTTQAAISQYLHSKRGHKGAEQFVDILPEIRSLANETARTMATGNMDTEEFMRKFCDLCTVLRKKRKL
jgi:predicted transcriptional regulator